MKYNGGIQQHQLVALFTLPMTTVQLADLLRAAQSLMLSAYHSKVNSTFKHEQA
jgi:hypothetical protein